MKISKTILISLIATFAMAQEGNTTNEQNATIAIKQEGVKYIKMLGKELKTNMKQAMGKDKNVSNAVDFCLEKAAEIGKGVNEKLPKYAKVRRTSLDLRDPKNKPDEIDTKVLNEYKKSMANGKFNPKDIKVVKDSNTTRVYKPLVVGKVCLACHGEKVSENIKAKITKKFPNDKAINLKKGSLRGAIVAEINK